MSKEKRKEEGTFCRWELGNRPSSTSSVNDFERELFDLEVGDELTNVPEGLYLFGTKTPFSGGWIGTPDITSAKRNDDKHFTFKTKGDSVWEVSTSGYKLPNEIGCSSRMPYMNHSAVPNP